MTRKIKEFKGNPKNKPPKGKKKEDGKKKTPERQ